MKKIIYLFSLISIFTLSSCEDEQKYGEDGTSVMVQIDAEALFSDANSRAVFTTDEEKSNVNRFCFLLYDGMNADSKLISATDIDRLPASVNLPAPGSKQYRAVLLGNVQLSDLVDGSGNSCVMVASSTFADLETPSFAFRRTDNALTDRSATDFTWSDFQTFVDGQKSLKFFLNPNVAKIIAKITNKQTDTTEPKAAVTNVRIKNVAPSVRYAQCALYESGLSGNTVEYPDESSVMLKYDMEKLRLPPGEEKTETIEWYVPHNWQGNGVRTDITQIPPNATYIEVDGVLDGFDHDFITASYKIYPGINEYDANGNKLAYTDTKNFNICADHIYTVNITITDDGIDYDVNSAISIDHVSETTKIKCFPESNCWFIHPRLQKTQGVKVWELPIDRINEYWQDVANNSANTITDKSEWVMEVIWQDQNARVIHFCDEYGNYEDDGSNNTYHGFGLNPAYITLDQTTLDETYSNSRNVYKDIYGNVLVGVRKPNESTYLWSWHLWVTDYCPDYAPAYNSDYGKAYVKGDTQIDYQGYLKWNGASYVKTYDGCVLHLRQADYSKATTDIWNNTGGAIWDSGIYKNKWMMDRMLGAQAPNNSWSGEHREGWGLYYQYGRKDPFPLWGACLESDISQNLATYQNELICYDITGTKQAGWTIANKASGISQGVENPTVFYSNQLDPDDLNNPDNGGSWNLATISNPWYSPTAVATGKKTLFDPCPPGWCLPKKEAFLPFSVTNGIYDPTTSKTDACTYIFLGPSGWNVTVKDNGLGNTENNPFGEYRHCVAFDDGSTTWNTYKPVFPVQGYISPTGNGLRLPTENGEMTKEIRGYMWTVDFSNSTSGYGYGYGTSSNVEGEFAVWRAYDTYNNIWCPNTYNSTDGYQPKENSLGAGYWGMTQRAFYNNNFSASRGQNVRCIQEPD